MHKKNHSYAQKESLLCTKRVTLMHKKSHSYAQKESLLFFELQASKS